MNEALRSALRFQMRCAYPDCRRVSVRSLYRLEECVLEVVNNFGTLRARAY